MLESDQVKPLAYWIMLSEDCNRRMKMILLSILLLMMFMDGTCSLRMSGSRNHGLSLTRLLEGVTQAGVNFTNTSVPEEVQESGAELVAKLEESNRVAGESL